MLRKSAFFFFGALCGLVLIAAQVEAIVHDWSDGSWFGVGVQTVVLAAWVWLTRSFWRQGRLMWQAAARPTPCGDTSPGRPHA